MLSLTQIAHIKAAKDAYQSQVEELTKNFERDKRLAYKSGWNDALKKLDELGLDTSSYIDKVEIEMDGIYCPDVDSITAKQKTQQQQIYDLTDNSSNSTSSSCSSPELVTLDDKDVTSSGKSIRGRDTKRCIIIDKDQEKQRLREARKHYRKSQAYKNPNRTYNKRGRPPKALVEAANKNERSRDEQEKLAAWREKQKKYRQAYRQRHPAIYNGRGRPPKNFQERLAKMRFEDAQKYEYLQMQKQQQISASQPIIGTEAGQYRSVATSSQQITQIDHNLIEEPVREMHAASNIQLRCDLNSLENLLYKSNPSSPINNPNYSLHDGLNLQRDRLLSNMSGPLDVQVDKSSFDRYFG